MKKEIFVGFSLVSLLITTSNVLADESGAGCGIGKQIMEGKTGKSNNIVAAILNDVLIPKTFFMTTGDGTLGCDPSEAVENDQQREVFVAANLDHLSVDMAKGQGDHLEALAQMMGIEEGDKDAFYSFTQEHYSTLFSEGSNSAKQMLSKLDDTMFHHRYLAKYVQ